jgi:hypothetical protein
VTRLLGWGGGSRANSAQLFERRAARVSENRCVARFGNCVPDGRAVGRRGGLGLLRKFFGALAKQEVQNVHPVAGDDPVGNQDVHLRLLVRIVEPLDQGDALHVLHLLERMGDVVRAHHAEAQVDPVPKQGAYLIVHADRIADGHGQVAARGEFDDAGLRQDILAREDRDGAARE